MYKISENVYLIFLGILFIFKSIVTVNSTGCIPVYMWGTIKSADVPSLKKIDQESFRLSLSNMVEKNSPVVVFVEENLSPEDFILYDPEGKPFSHLSQLSSSSNAQYWPCVKHPIKALSQLLERASATSAKEILDNPNFTLRNDDVLSIVLDDAVEGEYRTDMLRKHDVIMDAIYKKLKKINEDLVIIYTANNPSWISSEDILNYRKRRETPPKEKTETNNPSRTIYNNDDVLIYGTPTLYHNNTKVPLDEFKIVTHNKTEVGMQIIFESVSKTDVKVTFDFGFGGGYWILENITVHNNSAALEKDLEYSFYISDVYAPIGFSYNCDKQAFFRLKNKDQNLTFDGLQLQAYINASAEHKFGDAFDCVGFTSVPIWSGLFVTFILALIMTFGLTMMIDIKTMDSFDDPKGKTITINASE